MEKSTYRDNNKRTDLQQTGQIFVARLSVDVQYFEFVFGSLTIYNTLHHISSFVLKYLT